MIVNLSIDAKFLGAEDDNHDDIRFEANGETVGDCLNQYLATKPELKRDFFDKTCKLDITTYVFINKVPVISDHLSKEVKNGDEVRILFAQMHGC